MVGGLHVPEDYQILVEIEREESGIKLSSYTSTKMPYFLPEVVQRLRGRFIEYRDVNGSYSMGHTILHKDWKCKARPPRGCG